MSQSQVTGLETLLKEMANLDTPLKAYLLATTFHETAGTMQPITEYGGVGYFDKYDTGRLAAALGNTPLADGDGYRLRGRGYVMLTGRANYIRAGKRLGIDLIGNPSLANDPKIAAKILVLGCVEGWFTGKRLDNYLNNTLKDYVNARRVVNGVDDAKLIAGYAEVFEEALKLSSTKPMSTIKVTKLDVPKISILKRVLNLLRP